MNEKKAVTLLELVIAISLVAVILLGMVSLDLFSRYYLSNADKLSIVQNELAYIVDYMSKIIGTGVFGGAIGDINNPPIQIARYANGYFLKVFVDGNRNGRRDDNDFWVAFQLTDTNLYIWKRCIGDTCDAPDPRYPLRERYSLLSKRILSCCQEWEKEPEWRLRFALNNCGSISELSCDVHNTYDPRKNYIDIRLGACYDPRSGFLCGTIENPKVYIYTRIRMPAVSVN